MLKKIGLSVVSGALLAASWPTYGFPLLLFVAFVPLLWVAQDLRAHKKGKGQLFVASYSCFFVWTLATTWWVYNSTGIGMWVAVLVNSLLMTLVMMIYDSVARRATFEISSLFLVCLWIAFEYMHLYWEFSFPWLNLGNGFASFPTWIQWYEYTGTFGGTLWVWIVNIGVFKTVLLYRNYRDKQLLYTAALRHGLWIGIPLLISTIIFYTYEEKGRALEVVLLQPNINPYTEKYNTTDIRIAGLLASLTDTIMSKTADFIIAPETVYADGTRLKKFPNSTAKNSALRLLRPYSKASFLGGVSMYDVFKDSSRVHQQTNKINDSLFYDDYNAAFFVRKDGSTALYYKTKLVVGVENFPYQSFLKPILGDAMLDLGGTVAKKTTQEEREVFYAKDSTGVGPIICYESIYGEFVSGYVRNGADFLAIITNDAWWGNTQGHQQHLSFASLRAIETRRAIARSANTGISAIINQRGEIVQRLDYEEKGALNGTLYTNKTITFYTKYGNYIPRIALFLGVLAFLLVFTRRRGVV